MSKLNPFYVLAGLDHPGCRHYPTQDKHTPADEAEYIKGWRHAAIQAQAEDDFFRLHGSASNQ